MARPGLALLPDDILVEIFRLLPIKCKISLKFVCKRWAKLVVLGSLWTRVDLGEVPHFSTSQAVRLIQQSGHGSDSYSMKQLNLSGAWRVDTEKLLPLLDRCPSLKVFEAITAGSGRPLVKAEMLPQLATFSCRANDGLPHSKCQVVVDLEVDWSTSVELEETSSKLSEVQWSFVYAAIGGTLPNVSVRALFIEIFSANEVWPRILSALRANPFLEELHVVCLNCDSLTIQRMLTGLAEVSSSESRLRVVQIKYAEFQSPDSVRPLVDLCVGVPSLQTLQIVKCSFELGAEQELAQLLLASSSLRELSVDMGGKVAPLVHALTDNTCLEVIRLRNISEAGLVTLCEAVRHSASLKQLDLRQVAITARGLQAVAHALRLNRSLTAVRLDYGEIDCLAPTEGLVTGLDAIVDAVKARGGLSTLGVSIPDSYWLSHPHSPFWKLPKRFKEPPLASLLKGSRPLVDTLYITSPWEDWNMGDASAWRFWFNLSQSVGDSKDGAEATGRRGEAPRKGALLRLMDNSMDVVETWETERWDAGLQEHIPRVRSPQKGAYDLLLILLYPLVHLWQSVDSLYHIDCSSWNFLDWVFMAPLACFRLVGLIGGILTLYVVMYCQSVITRGYRAATRGVCSLFGYYFMPPVERPANPLRTYEGHRLLLNMV